MKEQSSISTAKIHLPNKDLVGLKITDKGKKIKHHAVLEGSKIHDKYEKLQKILDKRK